jgi:hypothetical protein
VALYGGDASELNLYRSFEEERINLFGQQIDYYVLSRGGNVDPVYNEPAPSWSFTQYSLVGAVTFQQMDNRDPSVRDEGFVVEWDGEAYFSYNEWDKVIGAKPPKEGDVLYAMSQYFDVVNAASGGNFVDTVKVVGYKILLRKRAKFDPPRKFVSEGGLLP